MNVADLHPLLSPSGWWGAAGFIGIIVGLLLVGWPLLVRLWRISERGRSGAAVPEQVRVKYIERIDDIEAAWRADELTPRQVAQRLGAVVREFARAAWGIRVDHMTLAELRAHRIEPIAAAVSRLYAAEFGKEDAMDAHEELSGARELVGRWS